MSRNALRNVLVSAVCISYFVSRIAVAVLCRMYLYLLSVVATLCQGLRWSSTKEGVCVCCLKQLLCVTDCVCCLKRSVFLAVVCSGILFHGCSYLLCVAITLCP